jgi:hypothetical protein
VFHFKKAEYLKCQKGFKLTHDNAAHMLQKRVQTLNRVTRLGEFSSIGQLNAWAIFSKITEAINILGATLFRGKMRVIILRKNGLGHILGDFFTHPSGHPDCEHENQWLRSDKNCNMVSNQRDQIGHNFAIRTNFCPNNFPKLTYIIRAVLGKS